MTEVLELPRPIAPEAIESWRRIRKDVGAVVFAPKSTLSLSQWADQKRHLSADLGEPGPWRTDRVPYMRAIMDAITDPYVREVTVMKATRIGATQSVVLNTIGYYIDQEPAPIIIALPTIDDAMKFSSQLLQPMLEDTPCLDGRVEAVKSKKRRNTMVQKSFPGGTLQIVGTKSPRMLRMVHGRIILMSEIDAMEFSSGREGDPTVLLSKRSTTYASPKIVKESSPLIREFSRIEPAFEAGTMERYQVPCPHCGEFQVLVFGGSDVDYGIKWSSGKPETAYYVCKPHGCVIEESAKFAMVAVGQWKAEHPERRQHRSFHLNAFLSPFEGARWPLLVKEWLDAQRKPERLQVFINTVLGETWTEDGEEIDAGLLDSNVHAYPCRCEPGKHEPLACSTQRAPAFTGVLVRTTDTQGDRLETAVWGWGEGEEVCLLEHEVLPGDPALPETHLNSPWRALALEHMPRKYIHETGAELRPLVHFIDSGGHHAKEVYSFCRPRQAQRTFAIKGMWTEGAPLLGRPSRNNAAKAILYPIGVFTAKESIMARFAKVRTPGPGFIHLPDWLGAEQLQQFASEKLVRRIQGGRVKRVWVKTQERNEMLDLFVYAMAALHQLGPHVVRRLGEIAAEHKAPEAEPAAAAGSEGGESSENEDWWKGYR